METVQSESSASGRYELGVLDALKLIRMNAISTSTISSSINNNNKNINANSTSYLSPYARVPVVVFVPTQKEA